MKGQHGAFRWQSAANARLSSGRVIAKFLLRDGAEMTGLLKFIMVDIKRHSLYNQTLK